MFKIIRSITLPVLIIIIFFPVIVFAAAPKGATISWQANTESDLSGYRVYYGTKSQTYTKSVFVDKTKTNYTFPRLRKGVTYYFSVKAIDDAGNGSDFSQEVSKKIPR